MSGLAEGMSLYAGQAQAKTGCAVPLFADGKPAASLYNPLREAERALGRFADETFVVFAGLADGKRVELFLNAYPANECIVIEKNAATFQFLKSFPSANAVMQNKRVRLLPIEGGDGLKLKECLVEAYVPALFKGFLLDILPSWQAHCPKEASAIMEESESALCEISADFSVQAHFGKVWLINTVKNLYNEAKEGAARKSLAHPLFPKGGKKALVVAAGPSLDEDVPKIRENRESLAIFAVDTAFTALSKRGIAADVVLSIDGQIYSARHFAHQSKNSSCSSCKPVLIQDICGCPEVARKAKRLGCNVLFAAGAHPLANLMAAFFSMPRLETSAGTVTVAAVDAAKKLGFRELESSGADFAFAGGKPYCRGTYFEGEFLQSCSRAKPLETMYAALMFRSPVNKIGENGKFTYKTSLLDGYKKAVEHVVAKPSKEWKEELYATFPAREFLLFLEKELRNLSLQVASHSKETSCAEFTEKLSKDERAIFLSILPLASFLRKKNPFNARENIIKSAINLALNIIERYTCKI